LSDVAVSRVQWTEDLIALVAGLLVFALALPNLAGIDLLGWAVTTSVWTDAGKGLGTVSKTYAGLGGIPALLLTYLSLLAVLSLAAALETADLLALGALADRVRAEESGDVVRVFANEAADTGPDVVAVSLADAGTMGFAILRRVAVARITGPRAARVRVDWSESGLEVAQVALGFGASELVGPLANRRGLPIADGATQKVKGAGMVAVQALKKKELEGLLAIAGRKAVFVTRETRERGTPSGDRTGRASHA